MVWRFAAHHATRWRVISVEDAGGKATGRPAKGPAAAGIGLKGRAGDRADAVPAGAGYNFALPLRWLARLLRALLRALLPQPLGLLDPA